MQDSKGKQLSVLSRDTFAQKYGIGIVLLIMVIGLSIASPTFRSPNNWISILQQISTNGVLALGMVFVITAGGIDLSIGSMLALTSVIVGAVLGATNSIPLAVLISVVACSIFGLINGYLVAKFNMFPFVVTLSTQLVIRGMAYIVAKGKSVSLVNADFRKIGLGKLWDAVPYSVLILIGVAIVAYVILHWTKFGRYIYAVGGNINAATASGINVFRTRVLSFVIMGACSGISGIILTSRINAAQPNIGLGYETDAIAACVIGGTSFAGGVSTIPGTMIGIIIIGVIYNGMNLLKVDSYYQTVVKGVLIIGAVMLDMVINKKRMA
ncbi:ABC transporter permease [Bacillota bacterium Meth-B3]|nr:ABC transporter permease [Christensenellaceae bacterium]MEA5067810.1 ABC transporter permease [Christensenellaceae bacterium]